MHYTYNTYTYTHLHGSTQQALRQKLQKVGEPQLSPLVPQPPRRTQLVTGDVRKTWPAATPPPELDQRHEVTPLLVYS